MTDQFGISDLIGSIKVDPVIAIKTPKDILSEEDYKIITNTFNIIAKYKSLDWMADVPEVEIQADIVALQVTLVSLAERFSLMSTSQDNESDRLKTARSKIRIALREQKAIAEKEGKIIKVTADDIKDASIALTEELALRQEEINTATSFLKFVYYSVRDAVSLLDKALTRIYKFTPEAETRQRMGHG